MQHPTSQTRGQQGFTLVELAIVLVIVGLLIGGILKGQELIATTRLTTTVAQIKSIEAAALTFQDTYNALPGDMTGAQNRLPNCPPGNATGCADGNGNGVLGVVPDAAVANNEGTNFFIHMSRAGLLDGVGAPQGGNYAIGQGIMGARVNSAAHFRAGSATVVANLNGVSNLATPAPGVYLAITAVAPGTQVGAAQVSFRPTDTKRMDSKYDDGLPLSGSALAAGGIQSAANAQDGCVLTGAADATADYAQSNNSGNCAALYVKVLS